jgi:hypothetical protein
MRFVRLIVPLAGVHEHVLVRGREWVNVSSILVARKELWPHLFVTGTFLVN